MYRLIFETLLFDTMWDFCNATVFCDAAFTSIKLFRDLHDKRGINAVGPINAGKPAKGAGPDSWPLQNFKSSDTKYVPRGWDRIAFTKLQRGGWLQALTWRDNKFVKILSSVFLTNEVDTVLRYEEVTSHDTRTISNTPSHRANTRATYTGGFGLPENV